MSQANPTQSGLLRRIVSSLLLLPFLLAVLYPFLWMVFGIFKTNREIYQPLRLWPMKPLETEYWSGIADTFFPNEFSMQNVRDLLVRFGMYSGIRCWCRLAKRLVRSPYRQWLDMRLRGFSSGENACCSYWRSR